MALGKLLKHVL